MLKRPMTRLPALVPMMEDFDPGDLWACAMAMGFALGDVGQGAGVYEVAAILSYNAGPAGPPDLDEAADTYDDPDADGDIGYATAALAHAYRAGEIDDNDLILGARVMSRYIDLLNAAGLAN